jgi:hypothetical protein
MPVNPALNDMKPREGTGTHHCDLLVFLKSLPEACDIKNLGNSTCETSIEESGRKRKTHPIIIENLETAITSKELPDSQVSVQE